MLRGPQHVGEGQLCTARRMRIAQLDIGGWKEASLPPTEWPSHPTLWLRRYRIY